MLHIYNRDVYIYIWIFVMVRLRNDFILTTFYMKWNVYVSIVKDTRHLSKTNLSTIKHEYNESSCIYQMGKCCLFMMCMDWCGIMSFLFSYTISVFMCVAVAVPMAKVRLHFHEISFHHWFGIGSGAIYKRPHKIFGTFSNDHFFNANNNYVISFYTWPQAKL